MHSHFQSCAVFPEIDRQGLLVGQLWSWFLLHYPNTENNCRLKYVNISGKWEREELHWLEKDICFLDLCCISELNPFSSLSLHHTNNVNSVYIKWIVLTDRQPLYWHLITQESRIDPSILCGFRFGLRGKKWIYSGGVSLRRTQQNLCSLWNTVTLYKIRALK